jgi:hypothetical protein
MAACQFVFASSAVDHLLGRQASDGPYGGIDCTLLQYHHRYNNWQLSVHQLSLHLYDMQFVFQLVLKFQVRVKMGLKTGQL